MRPREKGRAPRGAGARKSAKNRNANNFLIKNDFRRQPGTKRQSGPPEATPCRCGGYRAGLAELQAYTVSVSVGSTPLDGTVLLPGRAYTLPSSVSCPDGKRDATFFLTVDIAYLKANADKDFSLPVTISDPTRYALNDKLTTTQVRIDTSELLSKEGL